MTSETKGFIDIHHHIIYGVDDGPQTLEESRQMLALAYEDGTRHIIATPHFEPMRHYPEVGLLQERLAELSTICAEEYPDLQLHLGAEVLFGEGIRRKLRAGIIPTLAGSNYVLVEFMPGVTAENLEKAVRHLANGGHVTVLAHSERYPAITRNLRLTKYLQEKYGTLIQVNAEAFLSRQRFHVKRFLKKALRLGIIDIIASDAHNTTSRCTNLQKARIFLLKSVGIDYVNKLFRNTAINNLLL
ncbi:MAG: CpsB/CapC family capsule biosynthesis tyrosine phosphatase [Christensenellales bacterium]